MGSVGEKGGYIMPDFTTEELANESIEEWSPLGFCPLTIQECRKDCVCYRPARTAKIYQGNPNRETWRVYAANCGHRMLLED